MKTKQELLGIIKNQLAIEYNCSIDDFSSSHNIITATKDSEEKRHYINGTFFFKMATFGDNAVITANECIHTWLKDYTKDKKGHWIFEQNNIMKIEKKLNEHNKKLWGSHHMFLSYKEVIPKDINLKTEWFEKEAIHQFYNTKLFPNALCKKYNPKRPDILAVAAYDEDKIIGMSGCSADTPLLWQIGIDVHENYRGKGIGTYLVTLIKKEIEKRGKVPFYGTSLSNLYSWNIAINSGFSPVWIEITSIEEE
ncbi:MAG: GNAT family N-acetyltransferase [Treponema sp.]|nr:GNAT family N-acetyltransferase [Treponema sp.]